MAIKSLLRITRFYGECQHPCWSSKAPITMYRKHITHTLSYSRPYVATQNEDPVRVKRLTFHPITSARSKSSISHHKTCKIGSLNGRPYPSSVQRYTRCQDLTTSANDPDKTETTEKQLSIFARFKQVYKEYGKTLIAVHIVTSIVWYGSFYAIACSGIDLVPLLIKIGISEAIISKFETAGDFLVAYILYEITKPIRYLVTLAGTQTTVKVLRKHGYIPELKPEDRLRSLAKESRENLKEKYQERKDDFRENYEERKAEMKRRWEERKTKTPIKKKTGAKRLQRRKTNARSWHHHSHKHNKY